MSIIWYFCIVKYYPLHILTGYVKMKEIVI